ncbi:hypothetical protein HO566_04695 [Streptococcus suis]|nr:hypothetical protein [Streptococcus suis]
MAEELRLKYNKTFLEEFAKAIQMHHSNFDSESFYQAVLQDDWEDLALLDRFKRMADGTYQTLALPYADVVDLLIKLNATCQGFDYIFFNDIIWKFGLEDLAHSFKGMAVLTTGSTSEFAIRYFLNHNFDASFAFLKELSFSDNEHHRRLASEGTRLRLPWGKAVPDLVTHRTEIFEVLDTLKADPSLYVRKSVANNLNDMTKFYPDEVIAHLKTWKNQDPNTDWIIKTALRTLIKTGYPAALDFMGYSQDFEIKQAQLAIDSLEVYDGDTSQISYAVRVTSPGPSKFRLGLAFGFQKANGRIGEKIFYLKDTDFVKDITISGHKNYQWKDLTTRRHYSGKHHIRLLLNDIELEKVEFILNKQPRD